MLSIRSRRRSSNVSLSSTSSTHSNLADSAVFSQRIVSVDYYTSYPIADLDPFVSEFRGCQVKRVPVIRIYGATPRGQKTCTHVHGVFPYIYIEHTSDDPDFEYLLALALDNGINNILNSEGQHVFKIQKVQGRSFYGYKSSIEKFIQIFFFSPIGLKKGVELLECGKILGQRFQPYEAHITYILQFFLDFKLYGMNFIHFKSIKFRRVDESQPRIAPSDLIMSTPTTTGNGSKTFWDLEAIPENLLLPLRVTRKSRVELEIDVKASDVLVSSSSAQGKNPGIVDIWLDEKERRRHRGIDNWADITVPQSPERHDEENNFVFPREAELLQMLDEYLKEGDQSQMAEKSEMSQLSPKHSQKSAEIGEELAMSLDISVFEKEESDSILHCSQPHYDHDVIDNAAATTAENCHVEDIEDYEMEDEWAQDFLSQATIDKLDQWEKQVIAEQEAERTANEKQCGNSCDGQFDIDDDDNNEKTKPKKTKWTHMNSFNTIHRSNPLTRSRPRKYKSQSSIFPIKESVEVQIDSDSDSDCQVVSVVNPSRKKLRKVDPKYFDSKEPIEKIEIEEAEEPDKSELVSKNDQNCKANTSIKKVDSDKDSGITSFYDQSRLPDDDIDITMSDSDSDTSQEILQCTPPPETENSTKSMESPKNPNVLEHTCKDSSQVLSRAIAAASPFLQAQGDLMTSIYQYEDESFLNEDDESKTQTDSVMSVYDYSSCPSPASQQRKEQVPDKSSPETSLEGSHDKSFQNIVVDFSVPNPNADSEEYDDNDETYSSRTQESQSQQHESESLSSQPEISFFENLKMEHETKRRNRRQKALDSRDKLRPSMFQLDLNPLKQIPLFSEVHKWTKTISDEPVDINSTKYLCEGTNGNESKKKLLDDIFLFSRSIEQNQDKFLGKDSISGDLYDRIDNLEIASLSSSSMPVKGRNLLTDICDTESKQNDYDGDSSVDSDDEVLNGNRKVKPFRFFGADKSDSGASSDSDKDDDKTMVDSPASAMSQSQSEDVNSPIVSSQGSMKSPTMRSSTPNSIIKNRKNLNARIRNRLLFNIVGDDPPGKSKLVPNVNPDDSELDSMSILSGPVNKELNSSNMHQAKASHEHQFLTTLAVEVHCSVRGDFVPDPEYDSIQAIFFSIVHDSPNFPSSSFKSGIFYVGSQKSNESSENEEVCLDEISMLRRFIGFVHSIDPDILVGYEAEKFSWGYVIQRGLKLRISMLSELSRLLPTNYERQPSQDQWNETINGRIVFNLWKLLRHEVAVTSYTFEKMTLQILHEKTHRLTYKVLDSYWKLEDKREAVKDYFKTRVKNSMRIIDKLDLINRTSELARLFGIQFFEVLSRGSQFRVESMMLRLTKPESLIPPSPNPHQRARMKAPEYLPLILEPESNFYKDPVAVLDFQSLYPSMMIAYNYCFSTCIGRVENLKEDFFDLGCLSQNINRKEIRKLFAEDLIHISPCRVAFVKEAVKKGILSTMLEQILDTRQMVKRSMKKWKDNETLQKVLDSRQLGLKLIANVTYGYTSANWSGRMACVEIADSIVSKGRETLQRAIDYVNQNDHIFGGKVVYGDTDSLFVHFPGKTKEEAFKLAQKIVEDVTQANPKPVKLKLEKIYQPCILQTKKRYVGFAYEAPDQVEPKYDAKGIETVRRDGCPATAKILEGAIRVLFTKQEEAAVKNYVTEQFRKIFLGRVSLSKYTFARKFRGRSGYKPGAKVPSLEIAKKLGEKDKRAEPLPKERVPYIVIYGDPWAPLIQRIRRPEEFINDPNLRLNAHYYIEKAIIPALNRCLNLAGYHADKWLSEMPRKYLKSDYVIGENKKGTIDQYFTSQKCIKCESRAASGFCENCFKSPKEVKQFLANQSQSLTSRYESCLKICQDCSKEDDMICINMDCPVKHKYLRYSRDYNAKLPKIKELQNRLAVLDW